MNRPISIHSKEEQVELDAREYRIDVLGGWGVNLGEFSISFKHNQSQQAIESRKVFWPVQSIRFNKKARRIFVVKIQDAGTYTLEFKNPETIKLKESNLFLRSLFQDPIPNEKISICLH